MIWLIGVLLSHPPLDMVLGCNAWGDEQGLDRPTFLYVILKNDFSDEENVGEIHHAPVAVEPLGRSVGRLATWDLMTLTSNPQNAMW